MAERLKYNMDVAVNRVLSETEKNKLMLALSDALEKVGAKGMKFGKAQVADFHANFLINTGGATANDVKKLAEILKKKIKQKFGIVLEEEIRYF